MRLRPRAEVICFKGNKVLAGYHAKGYTLFPGGGIDPGESAIEAAKREAMEEADRRVITCTVAHPPTVQRWPDGYAEKKPWSKGYDGGLTYWMTGSTSEEHAHADPAQRHKDFEPIFSWHRIDEVLARLKGEVGTNSDWADDARVRIAVLQAHQELARPRQDTKRAAWLPMASTVAAPA